MRLSHYTWESGLGRRGSDHPQDLLKLAELELIDRHQRMVWTASPTTSTSWR